MGPMVEASHRPNQPRPHLSHRSSECVVGPRIEALHATGRRRSCEARLHIFCLLNSTSYSALRTYFSIRPRRAFVEGVLASIDRRERLEQESNKRRQAISTAHFVWYFFRRNCTDLSRDKF